MDRNRVDAKRNYLSIQPRWGKYVSSGDRFYEKVTGARFSEEMLVIAVKCRRNVTANNLTRNDTYRERDL